MSAPFVPTADVAVILHHLLDIYERRGGAPQRVVRVRLEEMAGRLPGYDSQVDPVPRATANEQFQKLAGLGLIDLHWQPGQEAHLLEAVALATAEAGPLYALLNREPVADQRRRLRALLLGDRFRLDGWRRRAVEHCLAQLKTHKSPAPFSLVDPEWNRDLLAALIALPDKAVTEELPYRVFSVRLYNDSKHFEGLKESVARLARRHERAWRNLSSRETLRELGLVANPGHLYLSGPWQLVDTQGQVMSLVEFHPSVGLPTALAARVAQVRVTAGRVVCVENLASFYELVRYEGDNLAAMCLWGNPSPASRRLLRCLAGELAPDIPLLVWADIDYGGLNILAQLRSQVSARFAPYRMDRPTLESHVRWAHPLTTTDERNLARLKRHASLQDMTALIDMMLQKGIKLEQEAVALGSPPGL